MKLFESRRVDERVQADVRNAAALVLGITQALLAGVILYRLYVLGQPDEQIRDLQAVLGISVFGFIAVQLFLGGAMPVPTWRGMLAGYLILTALVSGACLLIYGVPARGDWANTWLPATAGPAVLILTYALIAHLGKKRLERQIEE